MESEKQKPDPNIFPVMDLFPRLAAVAHACGRFITKRHCEPIAAERGAEAMLDRQMELDFLEGTEY